MKAIKRATLKEIKKAVKTLNNTDGEIFYINHILPFDKRSIKEILKKEQQNMDNTIAILIIVFIFYIMKAQRDLNLERINCDKWRETAILLNKQLNKLNGGK